MTRQARTLPRLGSALLNRLADRNEPLAGDILEGYQLNGSRLWLWRQLAGAILTGGFRRSAEIRPLPLVEFPSWQPPREDFAAKRLKLQTLGLSASPIDGIGGISIVIVIAVISLLQPMLWVVLACGVLLGSTAGLLRALQTHRRGRRSQPPTGIVIFPHH